MADLKMMKAMDVDSSEVETEGAEEVSVRWLISKRDGAPNFAMRLFEVGPGGRTPLHAHDWEHEVFVLEGDGELEFEGGRRRFSGGHFVFVPPGAKHRFLNTGDTAVRFLCLVPNDSY